MIKIERLTKYYGRLAALKDVTISFPAGSITAIVGPNGSGKTTLMKCILGLVKPSSGRIWVDGVLLTRDYKHRSKIGYLPQQAEYPGHLKVGEIIDLIAQTRGKPANSISCLGPELGISHLLDKPAKTLSGGMKQKLSAILAFMFDPTIFILDEPTAGLDPVSSSAVKDQIMKEKTKGKTIILTSHFPSEVQELADQVVFVVDGQVRFAGSTLAMLKITGQAKLERAFATLMQTQATAML